MKKNADFSRWAKLLTLVAFGSATLAMAQDAPNPTPRPAAPGGEAEQRERVERAERAERARMANSQQRGGIGGISFDEKQRQLLQEARQNNTEELRKLSEKLNDAQKEFVKLVLAEKYDEKTVREKAEVIGKLQGEILALNGKAFATVAPSLKAEQREMIEGNAPIGFAIINSGGRFGGPPMTGRPEGGFGAGRGGEPGNPAVGGRGGRPGGDAGGVAPERSNRRRDGDNRGQ